MAGENEHRSLNDPNLHECRGFSAAEKNTIIVKNERNESAWERRALLPPVLNIVSSLSVPPTEQQGDAYIISAAGATLNVTSIVWQSGNLVRYSFSGNPDLSAYSVGDYFVVKGAGLSINNGSFRISSKSSPGGTQWLQVTNELRTSGLDDETVGVTATGAVTLANWDGAAPWDWVRFSIADAKWYSITPEEGDLVYNKNDKSYYHFKNGSWNWHNTEREESVADDGTIDLPSGAFGFGEAYAFNNGAYAERARFYFSSDGTVAFIDSSTNTATSDTDGNLCVFDNGTSVRIKNRLGGTRTLKISIH